MISMGERASGMIPNTLNTCIVIEMSGSQWSDESRMSDS
jgi:hypothetical protein